MNEPTPAISLRDAAFGYEGRIRVARLTLELPRGAAVALIGPNGCGKSTLLRGILGLSQHMAGEIRVFGKNPLAARPLVAALPQSDTRAKDLPVSLRQVVTMGLYRSLGPLKPVTKAARRTIDAALERVDLATLANQRFGELSGGQQQRGILARALVAHPQLLLLDEPFNGLDQENRDMLLGLVAELREEGRTIVVSTHDLEIAKQACSHVLLLASGHVPGEPGHPAGFGPIHEALTLPAIEHAFQDVTVELDGHTVTTTREIE